MLGNMLHAKSSRLENVTEAKFRMKSSRFVNILSSSVSELSWHLGWDILIVIDSLGEGEGEETGGLRL